MKERVLIVEDDQDMREMLGEILGDAGYEAIAHADAREALKLIKDEREMLDLVITDVRMPGVKGDEILFAVRESRAEAPVIVITAFGSVEHAVEMVKAGAHQYITKPFHAGELLTAVAQALESTALQRAQTRMRREISSSQTRIIGASRPMRKLLEMIARAARGSSTVLITGESGTGKELVAQAIHEQSGREGQFVPINCPAIPEELIEAELFGHTGQAFTGAKQPRSGLFETADGGTIFLDEIADLPLAVQPKLLRTLQEGTIRRVGANAEQQVNVRVVAATNRDLEEEVREARFREDLFWRLNVIQLHVPALRERPYDIPLLVEHFVNKVAESLGRQPLDVRPETLAILTSYSWPGNVRELENAIERAATLAPGSRLTPDELPERLRNHGAAAAFIARSSERDLTLHEVERDYIIEMLRKTGGNKTRAAELLGLDRKTLYRKLEEFRGQTDSIEI
ncbi:MAG: sigma-54-dependent transcriptional regulator [Blastocatellales bacterium]